MAWDWNASGRIDDFKFQKVSSKDINTVLGNLECLVTGGTLSFSYYSDLKVTGELTVVNAQSSMAEDEYLIRIWYCPQLNGERQNIELGTFYFNADLHYEKGMYSGRITLRSMLARHVDDVTIQKWTLSKNKWATKCYKEVFKALGGFPKISGISDKKLSNQHIFDTGVKPMEILQYIADYVGGEITVNSHGQTVLQPYLSAGKKKKAIEHYIYANKSSVIQPGLEISNSLKEIPNRVVCVFEERNNQETTQYIGKAALAANEARSYQKIGKWITKYYKLTNCKKPYVKNLNAKAAQYLASLNHNKIYYEFQTYYQPIHIGEVIVLKYDNISVYGLVTDIDLNLSIGAQMRVKIRKV